MSNSHMLANVSLKGWDVLIDIIFFGKTVSGCLSHFLLWSCVEGTDVIIQISNIRSA